VYNIDNSIRKAQNEEVNEVFGDSFYQYLSNLPIWCLTWMNHTIIVQKKVAQALNELNPLLGLELTATRL
jgi:type III restriction enzyme